ncbi:hypothetical protein IAF53_20785, partial [Acinetobacter baumannii]|nr:hypothetical protein [Acinetobacter baumannii]
AILDQIQAQKESFGRSQSNAAKKIQVEFVSANPTSSLHVGHGNIRSKIAMASVFGAC